MSVSRVTYVHCDGCGDPVTPDPEPTTRDALGTTATEQRRDAASEGWSVNRPGGQDLCPDCRPDA